MLAIKEVTPQIEKIRLSIDRLELIGQSFDKRAIRKIYQPEFKKTLEYGTDKNIYDSYSILKDLHTNYSWYLDDIELTICDRPKRNYAPILQVILTEAQRPRGSYPGPLSSFNDRHFDG